jgi:hypothetical protein
MCTVLLSPGDNPIAVDKYIKYQYQISKEAGSGRTPKIVHGVIGEAEIRQVSAYRSK